MRPLQLYDSQDSCHLSVQLSKRKEHLSPLIIGPYLYPKDQLKIVLPEAAAQNWGPEMATPRTPLLLRALLSHLQSDIQTPQGQGAASAVATLSHRWPQAWS